VQTAHELRIGGLLRRLIRRRGGRGGWIGEGFGGRGRSGKGGRSTISCCMSQVFRWALDDKNTYSDWEASRPGIKHESDAAGGNDKRYDSGGENELGRDMVEI
jgi:hypothetical protein